MKEIDHPDHRGRFSVHPDKAEAGFTLVELLVALAMSALVMAAIFRLSMDQQKVHIAQDQVAEMQQNIRAAMNLLVKDIRMAGYDPTKTASAGCLAASAGSFHFSMDLSKDGDCGDGNEDVTFTLTTGADGVQSLGRKSSAANASEPVIPYVSNLEFYYTLADGTKTTTPASPAQIRLVQISLLVRAPFQDENYTNQSIYTTPSGAVWGAYNDHYRRRFFTTTVLCQNMGLI